MGDDFSGDRLEIDSSVVSSRYLSIVIIKLKSLFELANLKMFIGTTMDLKLNFKREKKLHFLAGHAMQRYLTRSK